MTRGAKTTMILQRKVETLGSGNSVEFTWQDKRRISGVLTTSQSVQNRVQELYAKKTDVSTHTFLIDVPAGITITTEDRFRLTSDYYDILYVGNPTNANRHLELQLRKLIAMD